MKKKNKKTNGVNRNQLTYHFINLIWHPPEVHLLFHCGGAVQSNISNYILFIQTPLALFFSRINFTIKCRICYGFDKTHIRMQATLLFSVFCVNAIFWHFDFVYICTVSRSSFDAVSNVICRWSLQLCVQCIQCFAHWYVCWLCSKLKCMFVRTEFHETLNCCIVLIINVYIKKSFKWKFQPNHHQLLSIRITFHS